MREFDFNSTGEVIRIRKIGDIGIPPINDAGSAILATLPPGSYTAILRGANDTPGIALAGVYQLDN